MACSQRGLKYTLSSLSYNFPPQPALGMERFKQDAEVTSLMPPGAAFGTADFRDSNSEQRGQGERTKQVAVCSLRNYPSCHSL